MPRNRSRGGDLRWVNTDAAHRRHQVASISEVAESEDLIVHLDKLTVDLSRNLINTQILEALVRDFGPKVIALRDAMYAGEAINITEGRKVLHVALRDPLLGLPESVEVASALNQMSGFADGVRAGTVKGCTGERFTHVVNIGIGGSDLGPAMAYDALANHGNALPHPEVRYLSNVDPEHLDVVLRGLDPLTTLVVAVSKTFTTSETMTNLARVREVFASRAPAADLREHFVAVTANISEAMAQGFTNVLPMWDWVGGRYSLGSTVGLSLMIGIGSKAFREMLAGMHQVDAHFATAELQHNAPFLLGVIDAYYERHFAMRSRAVVPYSSALSRFPSYLQQLEMESNGKRVERDGSPVESSGVVVWGGAGTDGQHAYFQFLHQGTQFVPVDFIGFARTRSTTSGSAEAHVTLAANLIAQVEALAFGATDSDPHRNYPGNRPTNVMIAPALTPMVLGQLVALYEHRVFVQGVVWNINSFDQWGVELGKTIASEVRKSLQSKDHQHDGSSKVQLRKNEASRNRLMDWF